MGLPKFWATLRFEGIRHSCLSVLGPGAEYLGQMPLSIGWSKSNFQDPSLSHVASYGEMVVAIDNSSTTVYLFMSSFHHSFGGCHVDPYHVISMWIHRLVIIHFSFWILHHPPTNMVTPMTVETHVPSGND